MKKLTFLIRFHGVQVQILDDKTRTEVLPWFSDERQEKAWSSVVILCEDHFQSGYSNYTESQQVKNFTIEFLTLADEDCHCHTVNDGPDDDDDQEHWVLQYLLSVSTQNWVHGLRARFNNPGWLLLTAAVVSLLQSKLPQHCHCSKYCQN